jgi:hypothetical protein
VAIGFASGWTLRGTHLGWADRDRRAWTTKVVLVALAAAVALRIVGVPPIDLHGPLHRLGVMDPLCGGTRAAFLLMSGRLGEAVKYNPIVVPLAAGALLVVVRAGLGWATGRWLDVRMTKTARRILIALCVVALVALEIRQQLNAPLLMQPWN